MFLDPETPFAIAKPDTPDSIDKPAFREIEKEGY